ncbi:hypothetical protein ACHAXT_011563, partial [Thalassiosira profunda]
ASSTALLRQIQTTQASLLVSVGRIPGTAMPPEWAASGAKLGFNLEVEFTNEPADYEMTKERLLKGDAMMGSVLLSVVPLNDPTFVSNEGTQTIDVQPGAYGCQIQDLGSRQYALRFFLDFPEGASRNDQKAFDRARKRKEDLMQEIKLTDARLDKIRSQKLEENILGNVVQRAFNLRHQFVLVERRGKLQLQLDELEQKYPVDSSKVAEGPNGVIYAKEGVIAVKRFRGAMGTREQYHWVGTFAINEFFEDE